MESAGVIPNHVTLVLPGQVTVIRALRQGYAQNCLDQEALNFFRQMQIIGSKMASTTITNFLPVMLKVLTTLGLLNSFVKWNSQGRSKDALQLFHQMEHAGGNLQHENSSSSALHGISLLDEFIEDNDSETVV
ncbi:hypothetical protein SUGI_0552070 [Cryptomeria japonica]|nr:hypothetical protein SUGI_0552070 [Cryptomeria japonica]